jgi:hypothetical protein
MAGTFSAVRGTGHLSLAKGEGKVIESQTGDCPKPSSSSSPLISMEEARRVRKRLHRLDVTRPSNGIATPKILWSDSIENAPNCVFFACNPSAPAVLTS